MCLFQDEERKRLMRETIRCPYCKGPVHRKSPKHHKALGQMVQRFYCPKTCKRYHLRSMTTGEILVPPDERPAAPVIQEARLPEVEAAELLGISPELLGISPESLAYTAKTSSGRPRIIINFLGDQDLEHLNDDWRERVEQLQRKALLINACLGAIRRGLISEKQESRDIAPRQAWIQGLPDHDLEMLLDVMFQWRHYFGLGPIADTETQDWAREAHHQLAAEKKLRRLR